MVAPIWWEWTAQEDGLYLFDTSGSDFDTVLYLLEDCQGAELTCNDDYSSLSAAAEIYALEGDSILVGVGSFAGRTSSGTIGVNISKWFIDEGRQNLFFKLIRVPLKIEPQLDIFILLDNIQSSYRSL